MKRFGREGTSAASQARRGRRCGQGGASGRITASCLKIWKKFSCLEITVFQLKEMSNCRVPRNIKTSNVEARGDHRIKVSLLFGSCNTLKIVYIFVLNRFGVLQPGFLWHNHPRRHIPNFAYGDQHFIGSGSYLWNWNTTWFLRLLH